MAPRKRVQGIDPRAATDGFVQESRNPPRNALPFDFFHPTVIAWFLAVPVIMIIAWGYALGLL
eukprot:m.131951 g.131951  ORF g.131951 m.131951 type:complete len:63 (-) comp17488_c0_seq1:1275-1463(-)